MQAKPRVLCDGCGKFLVLLDADCPHCGWVIDYGEGYTKSLKDAEKPRALRNAKGDTWAFHLAPVLNARRFGQARPVHSGRIASCKLCRDRKWVIAEGADDPL